MERGGARDYVTGGRDLNSDPDPGPPNPSEPGPGHDPNDPGPPDDQCDPCPTSIYDFLPDWALEYVIMYRNLRLEGDRAARISQLAEMDLILPSESCSDLGYPTVRDIRGANNLRLLTYAAYCRFPLEPLEKRFKRAFSRSLLSDYLIACLLLRERSASLGIAPAAPGDGGSAPAAPSTSRCAEHLAECPVVQKILLRSLGMVRAMTYFVEPEEAVAAVLAEDLTRISMDRVQARLRRFTWLEKLPAERMLRLCNLYMVSGPRKSAARRLARVQVHPYEPLLVGDGPETREAQVAALAEVGAVVPPGVSPNNYFEQNYIQYAALARGPGTTRPAYAPAPILDNPDRENLRRHTDRQLLADWFVPYESRAELLENTYRLLNEGTFFLPRERRGLNRETLLWNSAGDLSVFMVAHGTPEAYRLYELEEIRSASYVDRDGEVAFRHPDDPKTVFDLDEIEDLINLVLHLIASNGANTETARPDNASSPGWWSDQLAAEEATAFYQWAVDHLLVAKDRTEYDRTAFAIFGELGPADQEGVVAALRQLFAVGMYMRRWEGPGAPYPLAKAETGSEHGTDKPPPNARVARELGAYQEIGKRLGRAGREFLGGLPMVRYSDSGSLALTSKRVADELKEVFAGERCIRMASQFLIGTGYHYVWIFRGERIPGLDIRQVEAIT